MSAPVLVVGAGPSGLFLAAELRLAGVEVTVLERSPDRSTGENLRAHMLHARAADLLDLRGLMDPLRKEDPPVWPMIHFGNFWLDLSKLLATEHSLMIPQANTVRVLEERARELGADIRRGHTLTAVERGPDDDADDVAVRVSGPDGEYDLTAAYLVGCDGENSTVRALAGFATRQGSISWYGLLADFDEADGEWESANYPTGIFAVVPHPVHPTRVRLMTMEFGRLPDDPEASETVDELRASIARITGKDLTVGQPDWIYRYSGLTQLVTSYRRGRVFLVGDAAHVHYFGAGHGTSTSLHDAANLGWKLAGAINGWAPPGLLDTYHAERHPVGDRVRMSTDAQLALQYPPETIGPLRDMFGELVAFEDVNDHLVRTITEVRYPISYPGRRFKPASAHPLLGRPVPAVEVDTSGGAVTLTGTLHGGRGVLVDASGGTLRPPDLTGWAGRLDVVTAEPSTELDAAALLVRPDGVVAWADRTGTDAAGLELALTTWLGAPGGDDTTSAEAGR
ncbi:FAD-dependent monooxygenase [Micromonospora lupini]|uniref:FAD-dependent monooxygenase n=1 Tax=Micromonospora lupini TaxID=285679 RepID=UPI0033C79420